MRRRVAITGMGSVTAAGADVPSLWDSVRNGRSAIRRLEGDGLDGYIGARISSDGEKDDKASVLVERAALEAVRQSGLTEEGVAEAALCIGSSKSGIFRLAEALERIRSEGPTSGDAELFRNALPCAPSLHVGKKLGIRAKNLTLSTSCTTGIHSIIHAARDVGYGRCDVVIAGSVEASITPLALAAYRSMGVLSSETCNPEKAMKPFDSRRDGFAAGEGAGVLVMESMEHAAQRGADVLAEVLGWGYGNDHYGVTSHDPTGETIAAQMTRAIGMAGLKADDIDYINAHGTATRQNDAAEAKAIVRAFGDSASGVSISSTKPVTGHLLGAAGSVETIITVLAMMNSMVPPTMNLEEPDVAPRLDFTPGQVRERVVRYAMTVNYGFGGHIGALVLGKRD